MIDAWASKPPSQAFEVLPENWAAVALFLAAQTQWRRAGLAGVPTGLDYAGVVAAARLSGVDPTPETFDKLRIMEAAALDILLKADR